MDDVICKFSFQDNGQRVSFSQASELTENQFLKLQHSFLSFETYLHESAAIQWLSDSLKLDATKLVDVNIDNKKESLP